MSTEAHVLGRETGEQRVQFLPGSTVLGMVWRGHTTHSCTTPAGRPLRTSWNLSGIPGSLTGYGNHGAARQGARPRRARLARHVAHVLVRGLLRPAGHGFPRP